MAAEAARLHRSSQFIENHVHDTIFINHAKHGNVTLIFDAVHVIRITHSHFDVTRLVSTIQLRYERQRRRRTIDFNNFPTYKSQLDKNQCPNGIDAMELNVRLKRVQCESLISIVKSNNRIKQIGCVALDAVSPILEQNRSITCRSPFARTENSLNFIVVECELDRKINWIRYLKTHLTLDNVATMEFRVSRIFADTASISLVPSSSVPITWSQKLFKRRIIVQ